MLDDDKFSIIPNITSFAVGCIIDAETRRRVCDRLSIGNMLYDLDTIAYNNKDLSSYIEGDTLITNPFMKSFLIGLDKTVYTISRMSLPPELGSSDLFRTGITLKSKGVVKE